MNFLGNILPLLGNIFLLPKANYYQEKVLIYSMRYGSKSPMFFPD